MKSWFKKLKKEIPWLDGFLLLCLGIFILLFYISKQVWTWSFCLKILFFVFVISVYGCFIVKDMYLWILDHFQDLQPQQIKSNLSPQRLQARLQQIQHTLSSDICSLKSSTNRTIGSVNNIDFIIRFQKEKWCAAIGMPHGGILSPNQLRRIAKNTPLKLPNDLISMELTSCILCYVKGQIFIYPQSVANQFNAELGKELFAEDDQLFETWLNEQIEE